MKSSTKANHLETAQLDNGLQLVFFRLKNRNALSVNFRVDSGSRCETEQQLGLAHLVEHMLFQGTYNFPSSLALTSKVESLGGEIWGATHTEYGSYWLNVPRQYLSQTLPVFADMLRNPLFSATAIKSEKKVIIEEIEETNEQGRIIVQSLLDQGLWYKHPLGRPIVGTKESVKSFSKSDVNTFYNRYFGPNRMVGAVVGDIDKNEAIDLFDQVWGDWRPSLPLSNHEPPAKTFSRILFQEGDSNVLHIMLGFKTPNMANSDWGAHTILRVMLGMGMSSLLYDVLRSNGLCYNVESDFDELRDSCVLTIYIATQPKNVIRVFEEVIHVFNKLKHENVSQKIFENARKLAIGHTLIEADDVQYHARILSLSAFLTGKILSFQEQIFQLEKATLPQFSRVISEVLTPDNMWGGVYGSLDETVFQQCCEIAMNRGNWVNNHQGK